MSTQNTNNNWLETCLAAITKARVSVFGDFCLDAYWIIDPDDTELSVETNLPVRRVREQRYSLGGAGNVIDNLVALGVGTVQAGGLIGDDLFGRQMVEQLEHLNVNCQGLLRCQQDWQTLVYAKPCIGQAEQNRIDFGGFNALAAETIEALAQKLDRMAGQSDVVILNQQIPGGVSTAEMIVKINEIVASHSNCKFIADSRHRAQLYRGCLLKLNSHEAAKLAGQPRPLDERITAELANDLATMLFKRVGRAVFITRGENGLIVADHAGLHEEPGIQIIERTDPVGAGDTVVAAISAVMASGGDCTSAAKLGNIAAAITVRKLQTTGTASPDEILQVGPNPDYIHLPELADDPRQARYLDGTEIELIRRLPHELDIRHAIFDHDGTISTLRQGWEQIMVPMMVRAILGPLYEDADEALYHKVVDTVGIFIDKTTGVQTLVQMQGLIKLVRQFGCVPEDEIMDIHGYKAVYNHELLAMVRKRVEKLRKCELDTSDFLMKNAQLLLERLHAAGVKLYLASGTDQTDVLAEVQAMGYAHLFEDRIFGAVGDVTVEAKKVVLERIIRQHNLKGSQLVTFGDGPVEIRETKKRSGITVGVASDEVRRFGPNPVKRARLIRAGADIIVGDFTQLRQLLVLLGIKGN
ncbi:MAG: HAD family hydrolase [Planctomycetes bacterium]|nr:HAD family hydrolase [Planctomycetota bacterium]